MSRYSTERDLTMTHPPKGPGMTPMRRCWACNQNKSPAGGQLNKRTRLWRCAACAQKGTR